MGLLSKESGPKPFDGFREESSVSTVSLFPWGGFSPQPLADPPSRLSSALSVDLFSQRFFHLGVPQVPHDLTLLHIPGECGLWEKRLSGDIAATLGKWSSGEEAPVFHR